jgi:DNA-binding NtrC family response regulator
MTSAIAFDQSRLSDLLTSRQYREALDCLNLLDVRSPSLSRTDLAQIFFARAQCLYRLGEYSKAAIKLKCSIKFADPLNDNLFYARQKYTLGQIYQEMGRLDAALNEFTEASAFFHRVKDTPRKLAAQEMMALIHFHKGNYAQARDLNETILSQAKGLGLIEHIKVVTFNLCRVLLLTGDLRRAQSLLSSVADEQTEPVWAARIANLSGMLDVSLLDYEAARAFLQKALDFYVSAHYRRDEVVCLEYLGLNEYYNGDYAAAKRYYQQILAKPELTASAVAQTMRLLTDVQVALGELDDAEKTANKAEEAITRIKEWVELGCLHRARALLSDKRGDRTTARDCFAKSFEVLSRHGARYELAVTYLVAGRSACYSNEVQLEHLNKSKSLFVDMDVSKRVAQVEQAIAELNKASTRPHNKRNHKNSGESSIVDPDIVTEDLEMKRILADAFKLANTDLRILITGETGTGKDLLAQRIHCLSARKAGPFRNENMSRLPRELAESELFGCEKGSHSGALAESIGLIESADGGTFCLNEIAELPLDLQAKLLQVIEHRKLRRVGGTDLRAIDVRFIAMTNADLDGRVAAGLFRPDLRQRLTQEQLHLPPLRERKGDLPLLTQFFLRKLGFGDYDLDQAALIMKHCGGDRYDWPGNVRELQSVLEAAVTLTGKGTLTEFLGRLKVRMQQPSNGHSDDSERAELTEALKRNGGNQSKAARELMMSPSSFRRRLQRHSII